MFIYVDLDAVVGNHKKNGICVYIEAVCCEGLLSSQRFAVSMHIQVVLLCCVMLFFCLV